MSTEELTTRFAFKFFILRFAQDKRAKDFLSTSYIQGQEVQEAKEAVESARAGLLQKRKEKEKDQGRWSVATRRGGEKKGKEKDQGRREGGSAKTRFGVSYNKNFFFGSRVFGFKETRLF